MLRPLFTLPLPVGVQSKLQESGFFYVEDLYDNKGAYSPIAIEIVRPWNINLAEYVQKQSPPVQTSSAFELWQTECSSQCIVSFSKELDDVLDGGLPVRSITELCGSPGSGKTQMCIQFCIDVQIPMELGGLEGESIFISTDSGFNWKRLKDMAAGCLNHCQFIASQAIHQQDCGLQSKLTNLSTDSFLKGVHLIATHNAEQLIAAVHLIQEFILKNTKVRLIVIDSIAFPLRDGEMSTLERTGIIYRLLGDLESLAYKHSLAILVTNQLTTKIVPNKESQLIPAMGDNFGHRVSHRLMLGRVSRHRFAAIVVKSSSRPNLTASFQITCDGIRDCE